MRCMYNGWAWGVSHVDAIARAHTNSTRTHNKHNRIQLRGPPSTENDTAALRAINMSLKVFRSCEFFTHNAYCVTSAETENTHEEY